MKEPLQNSIAIRTKALGKIFKLPHEKNSSLKSLAINFYRRDRGYELQKALSNVSLEIGKGDFFGIVGRNGSGKSTLLKILAGIYTPTSGKVEVNGALTPFIELGVGFSPELTGRENIYLNGSLLGFSRKEMDVMYDDIVSFAELKKFMDQKLKNYSSGMQVRLAFSIAIRARTDILLIDEVLAVGDAAFQQKCYDYFEEIKKHNKTVILVSHDMSAVKRFCNKAALLDGGKLVFAGDPARAAELYNEQNKPGRKLYDDTPSISQGIKISGLNLQSSRLQYGIKESITVSMEVVSQRPVKAFPGINIHNQQGQLVAGVASQYQLETHNFQPNKKVKFLFTFPSSQLVAGTFRIDGVIYEAESSQPIFFKDSMVVFETTGGNRGWGSLNLKGKWQKF